MNADDGISLIWGVGALVLVVSSLAARQLPIGKTIKMALAWIAIFGGMFVLFLFKDEGRVVWQRATAELTGNTAQIEGSTLRIARHDDGHYWVNANVNGKPVRFMIDSGATTTTLSPAAAKSAGVEPSGGFPVMVETANGTVEVQRARIETLTIGNIVQRDAAVLVGSDGLGDTNLLGMSFLSTLKSWRVEGGTLILEP
jgi:aspartyl protease family protein